MSASEEQIGAEAKLSSPVWEGDLFRKRGNENMQLSLNRKSKLPRKVNS